MSALNFPITMRKAHEEALACIQANLMPMFFGPPGVGKSSIFHAICTEFNLKPLDVRASQLLAEDFNGIPFRNQNTEKAEFVPFNIFPTETDDVPEGYDGWLLILDELTSAPKPVQPGLYKLILDRMVGLHKLHSRCRIVGAGNRVIDNAVANKLSTALQSRMINYDVNVDPKEWMEDIAIPKKFDYRILACISYRPQLLMDFRPDHTNMTFACPRTWEFVSKLIKQQKEVTFDMAPRIGGAIGPGPATEFISFCEEYGKLPNYKDIVADPTGIKIPPAMNTKFACASMLMETFETKDLGKILQFIERLDIEIQILFCRGVLARDPKLRATNEEFDHFLKKMIRFLRH